MFARSVIAVSVLLLLGFAGWRIGLIGFHYPQVVRDQPFTSGLIIVQRTDGTLTLADGSTLEVDPKELADWPKAHLAVGDRVQLQPMDGQTVMFLARVDGWICGTPWNQPIRIPLFRDIVYRNRIEPVCEATVVAAPSAPTRTPPAP